MRKLPLTVAGCGRTLVVCALAILLATTSNSAQQSGSFDPQFEGQLFAVRHELLTEGFPTGVTFIDGVLYVADFDTASVHAFDAAGQPVDKPFAEWGLDASENPLSPLSGLMPNLLSSARVAIVDGTTTTETTALLLSDSSLNRVLVFDTDGRFLFKMQLDWPGVTQRGEYLPDSRLVPVINGMAMAPNSRLVYTPAQSRLSLEGTFAAAFAVDFGKQPGAVLVYRNQSFTFDADVGFETAPHDVLTNGGTAREMLGVAFDLAGNLYAVDTVTERLTAYGANLQLLFTFGTPVPGGTTAEFYEPYALMFWPGATPSDPGRLFIADAINNRIVAYRPNLAASPPTLDFLFPIEGFTIDGLDNAQPYALALDVATGRIATSDASGVGPRSWILQTRNLAAFDVRVLDAGGNPIESVCSGDPYMVQFGLTVPAGWPPVSGVLPELLLDGVQQPPPTTSGVDLDAEEAAIYTYALTAPGSLAAPFVGEIAIVANGTGTGLSDRLARQGVVPVRNCFGQNPAPTISATPNIAPQASGWTPVEPGTFAVSLAAADDSAVTAIQYEFVGANDLGFPFPVVSNPNPSPAFGLTVSLPQPGYTTMRFRARDDDGEWSEWQTLDVYLAEIRKVLNREGDVVSLAMHPADVSGVTYSATGLPAGVTIDPLTGVLNGTLSFEAAGTYTPVLFETAGSQQTQFAFTWEVLNVNRPPAGVADTYQVDEDGVLQVAAPGVAANDADPDHDTFQIFLHTPAAGLTFNGDGSFSYAPAANFNGVDAFRYRLRDQHGVFSDPIDVTLTVNPVNDAPSFVPGPSQQVLEDAGLQTVPNWATAISAGPPNEAGQVLTFVIANSNPALFAIPPEISSSGVLTYRPAANQSGTAIVTVHLQDSGGTASGGDNTSETRTFTITVDPINDAPTAVADAYSMIEGGVLSVPAPGVLANDGDVDNVALQAALVTGPAVGTLALQPNGAFTFTPPAGFTGSAAFTYTVTDGALSATAAATITVAPANLPPVCSAAVATPLVIRPANHKAVYVSISGVTDPEARPVAIRFTAILQDEPTNTQGDGNTTQDGDIESGGARAWVRAERSGSNKVPGDGRVYLISFVATDAGGLTCPGTVQVSVAHDQGGKPAVLSPGRWNSRTGQKLP